MESLVDFFSPSYWFGESSSPQPKFNRQEWIDVTKLQQRQHSITVKDWKKFNCVTEQSQIKTTIGLSLFGHVKATELDYPQKQPVGTEPFDIASYYELYDDKTQSIINEIFNLIVENKVENDIYLGHTNLFCLIDKCQQFVYSLLRAKKNNGDVVFFDHFGRYYDSWSYFETTNKLPVCDYIVPIGGVYSSNNNIVEKRNKTNNYDTGPYFVPALLNPSLMVVNTVNAAASSVMHLIDRYNHKQTINPFTDRESLWQYGLLSGSVLSGASAVSFRYLPQLESAIGSRATNMIRLLIGGSVVAVDGSIAATALYNISKKIYYGEELSRWDLLDLSLNIFLIYGLTIQVSEINKLMTEMNKPAGSTAKLSKTAKPKPKQKKIKTPAQAAKLTEKRKLQRKRAQARANEVPIASVTLNVPNGNILYNEIEYSRLLLLSPKIDSQGIVFLPHGDIVVDAWSQIMIRLARQYFSHKINLENLITDITTCINQIYSMLRTDVVNIIQRFSRYAPRVFNFNAHSNDPFLLTVMNETVNAKDIMNNLFNDVNLHGLDTNEQNGTAEANYDNTEETEKEAGSSSSLEINYNNYHYQYHNSLIDAIHRSYIIPSRNVPFSQSLRCYNLLLYTKASYFLATTLNRYRQAVNINKNIFGEETASLMVSKTLGKFVDGEFYPTKEFIEEQIDSLLPEENHNSGKHFEDAFNLIGERIKISYNNCFEREKFGLEKVIEIINYTVDNLIEECLSSYNEKRKIVHWLYEENVEIAGVKIAKNMLDIIGLSLDESNIFKAAFDEVNMQQFEMSLRTKFKSDRNNFVEPSSSLSSSSESNRADDNMPSNLYEMIGKIVQQFCNKLFKTRQFNKTEELHKKIFIFVVKSISEAFKSDVEKKEQLNVEEMEIMDQTVRVMLNNLRIMEHVKHRYLVEKYKWFTSEVKIEQLVSEFRDFTYTREFKHPRIYGSFIDPDSLIIYEVMCADYLTDEGYIDIARREFNLEIDSIRAAVTRLDNKVVIIYANKIIHFLYRKSNEGSTMLTLIDVDNNDNLL